MSGAGLSVEGLSLDYAMPRGTLQVLRDVSFSVAPGGLLALVGESGSGKSTIGYACAGWMAPNARRIAGRILIDGQEVTPQDRGRRVAMVFQDPGTALNPAMRLLDQITEVLVALHGMGAAAARRLARDGYRIAILSSSGKGEALAGELGGIGVTGSTSTQEPGAPA